MRASRPYHTVLLCLVLACEPGPDSDVAHVSALQVAVRDSAVFAHIKEFEIHVFKELTADGVTLSCVNFPDKYTVESKELVRAAQPVKVAADPSSPGVSVESKKIVVPAGEPLVFIARGLAPWNGPFVVGRGCADNVRLSVGANESLKIDVRASTGRRCTKDADCERDVTCYRGTGYSDGYCAFKGCSQGSACPPGSVCIPDNETGGLCMRRCISIGDCDSMSDPLNCEGRPGIDTSEICSLVCVYSMWHKDDCCNCGSANSGL